MVANHELIRDENLRVEADRNLLIFVLSEVSGAVTSAESVKSFLLETFQAFCAKAAKIRFKGWFYAWHDEMSGTLRCGACSVERAAELPFSCQLDVVNTPDAVATAVATSPYSSGIPASEFTELKEWTEDIDVPEFRLTVFARPLISAV